MRCCDLCHHLWGRGRTNKGREMTFPLVISFPSVTQRRHERSRHFITKCDISFHAACFCVSIIFRAVTATVLYFNLRLRVGILDCFGFESIIFVFMWKSLTTLYLNIACLSHFNNWTWLKWRKVAQKWNILLRCKLCKTENINLEKAEHCESNIFLKFDEFTSKI